MATTAIDFGSGGASARLGPNAIIRLQEALLASVGAERARSVFERAGQEQFVVALPERMVNEASVTSLYTSLPTQLGPLLAAEVSGRAGWLTGDYLLANRIPKPVQALLRVLPAALAARVLVTAIRRNAWTFVGSGCFDAASVRAAKRDVVTRDGRRPRLSLRVAGCPICAGSQQATAACTYYAAAFESLFVALVHRRAQVREVACHALGAADCTFEVSW